MKLNEKEKALLNELKTSEQLCVTKYQKYAEDASDSKLQKLFTKIGDGETKHLESINSMLAGTEPTTQMKKPAPKAPPDYKSTVKGEQKKQDAYLCSDALYTEKHVSSEYNTSLFEFVDPKVRTALNHIQTEEQNHGDMIYNYMAANNMY